MKTEGREESSNIEDRRGQGGGLGGGGGGLGGGGFNLPGGLGRGGGFNIPMGGRSGGGLGIIGIIVVLGIIWFVTGQNPLDTITGGSSSSGTTTTSSTPYNTPSQWAPPGKAANGDDLKHFVGVVVKDLETYWGNYLAADGTKYAPPHVVLYTSQTQSGCGVADANAGPFYCPNDSTVYIDLSFYDQLRDQFGAAGDFAEAYVIAHEVGHHIQNILGVLPEFNDARARMSQDQQNAYSVRVELQADCYAGVWANWEGKQNLLDQGDTQEAITAANAIGDDTLTRGQVSSRNFTHGTSAQRMSWLKKGMTSGDPAICDTFHGNV